MPHQPFANIEEALRWACGHEGEETNAPPEDKALEPVPETPAPAEDDIAEERIVTDEELRTLLLGSPWEVGLRQAAARSLPAD